MARRFARIALDALTTLQVEAADLGNNFFVTAESVGHSRARIVTELLKELNEFVRGYFIEEDPVHLIDSKPTFVREYTHVIASSLPEAALRKLSAICWEHSIPLIVVRSYGLLGYLRIAIDEHRVVESKRENVAEDLRLFNPFPELLAFANSFDYSKLNDPQFSHVPYAALLIQALAKWRKEHDGKAPTTSAEKTQFRADLKKSARSFGQENIEEAIKAAPKYCWQPVQLRSEVAAVLKDPKIGQISDTTPNFWVLATALRDFIANEGQGSLPQAGIVPDMHSDTESFIALQKIYQEKANKDLAVMVARVNTLLAKASKHAAIHEDEVKSFCRNAQFLQVLRYTSIESELTGKNAAAVAALKQALEEPNSYASWYLVLRAADRFISANGRYPGAFDDEVHAHSALRGADTRWLTRACRLRLTWASLRRS